jgi:hypothetical protein
MLSSLLSCVRPIQQPSTTVVLDARKGTTNSSQEGEVHHHDIQQSCFNIRPQSNAHAHEKFCSTDNTLNPPSTAAYNPMLELCCLGRSQAHIQPQMISVPTNTAGACARAIIHELNYSECMHSRV